jgi:hypothetical protein
MLKKFTCIICMVLIGLVSGCGGDKVSLKGKVTFKEDGTPLTCGMVCFETDTFAARGPLTSDGTYQVTSVKKNDGIPKGSYKVFIFGAEAAVENPSGGMREARSVPLVAQKYTNRDTSGLTFEVDGTTKEFNFEVEKP